VGTLWNEGLCVAGAPALGMRVPQAPQKAKPVGTPRPQFGQVVPSGATCTEGGGTTAAGEAAVEVRGEGPGVKFPACEGRGVGCCVDGETAAGATDGTPEVGRAAHVPATEEVPPDDIATGAGVGSSAGAPENAPFGCSGAGIFGESPQGIPPFGLAVAIEGSGVGSVASIPAWDLRSGGRMVRAVSRGAGSRAGLAAALISFPQPRQNL
jgi:hypothetical protein